MSWEVILSILKSKVIFKIVCFSAFSLLKVCENGKYGQGCTSFCGHCFNSSRCHHANGSCLTGCEPGYGGEYCKSRKINMTIFSLITSSI